MTDTSTAIIIDEETNKIQSYPAFNANTSLSKSLWLSFYRDETTQIRRNPRIFQMCENQFKKFRDKGITPMNFDW